MTNVDVSVKNVIYVNFNPSICICENGKYLASIMNDSVITCDESHMMTKQVLMKKSNL